MSADPGGRAVDGQGRAWPLRWLARWIWAPGATVGDRRQVVVVRRVLDVADPPHSAPARVFAEAGYILFVNGAELARGPGRGNPRSRRYDVVDVGPALVAGTNVVTIIGFHHGRANAWWMPAPISGGVGRGGIVFEADLGDEVLVSDRRWEARILNGWTTSIPTGAVSARGREVIDLRQVGADLHGPHLDGPELHEADPADPPTWAPALERSAVSFGDPDHPHPPTYPFGPTQPSALTRPSIRLVPLRRVDDHLWVAEEVVVGTLVVDLDGRAGDGVAFSTAERLDEGGRPLPDEEDIGLDLVAGTGPASVETIDRYGLRAVGVSAPETTTVTAIGVRERLHPVTGAARFACSDPLLDDIWAVGRRTVSLCSLDAYVDCPTREQRAWTGDAVVHQMVDLATNDDWSLARWHPRLSASPRPDGMLPMAVAGDFELADDTIIPDWALHWVRSVWNLHRYVGDVAEIAELLPVVERVVSWFDQFTDPESGLPTDVYGWVIVDWASVPTDGASAALTGLLGRALRDLAELSDFVGDAGRAERARTRHAALASGFEAFWDAGRQRYADTLVDGVRGPTASQHGQAAAVVAEFVPPDRLPRLVELLSDPDAVVHATYSVPNGPAGPGSEAPIGGPYLVRGHPDPWWDTDARVVAAQPFFRYVVHDALVEAGRADLVAAALLDWAALLERCPTSWSETWFGGTTSHGWSSTPTRDLMVTVLGVGPAEPGFAVAEVSPALGHLTWAEGVVPTPAGPLTVRVDAEMIDVDTPLPVVVEGAPLPAGHHRVPRSAGRAL